MLTNVGPIVLVGYRPGPNNYEFMLCYVGLGPSRGTSSRVRPHVLWHSHTAHSMPIV